MPDAFDLYPKAQPPQQNLLSGNPLSLIQALGAVQDYQIRQQQAPALGQIPAAALRGQQISNQTQQQALDLATRDSALRSISQGLDPNKSTADDVYSGQANFMRANPSANPAAVNAAADVILNADSKTGNQNIKGGIAKATNMLTPPETGLVTVNHPQTGQPITMTRQQANFLTLGQNGGSGFPSAPAPGVTDRLAANQTEFAADQSRSAQILAGVRPLQQALPLIEQLSNANFGPGSSSFAHIKGALSTAGIIDPNTSDLQLRQEVGKYLLNYAQGAQNAGRSDSALSTAIGSNPNLDLTQPANLSLVKNQIARDRMDAALPLAAGTADNYKDYKSKYYQTNDVRAFGADMISPDQKKSLMIELNKPGNEDKKKRYINSLRIADQNSLIRPQGDLSGGQ